MSASAIFPPGLESLFLFFFLALVSPLKWQTAAKSSAANLLPSWSVSAPSSLCRSLPAEIRMYEFIGTAGGCSSIKWTHASLVASHVCCTSTDALTLYTSVDPIILSCPWFMTENCYIIPSTTLNSYRETNACHSSLWIKMDDIMGVSFQPCNVAVIAASWNPMYIPRQRNIPQIPWGKFHSHISPAASPEYEINQRGWMETKLPRGIMCRLIKNTLRSWEELVRLQGRRGDKPNQLGPVMLPRSDFEHLPSSERQLLLSCINIMTLLMTKWPL